MKLIKNRIILEDLFSDYINYKLTSLVFIFIAIVIEIVINKGTPIQCWMVDDLTKVDDETALKACFYNEYYFLKVVNGNRIENKKIKNEINHYQYYPLMLICQSFLFCLPHLIWYYWLVDCQIDLRALIKGLRYSKNYHLSALAIRNYINDQRDRSCNFSGVFKLNFLYMLIKFSYLINVCFQLFFTKHFIGADSIIFGLKFILNIIFSLNWNIDTRFPPFILSEAKSRKGFKHMIDVECQLPVNDFLQEVFIFIDLWILVVGIITIFSNIKWIYRVFNKRSSSKLIASFMKSNKIEISDSICKQRFFNYLQNDGIFIISIISTNCGNVIATEIIIDLWEMHQHDKITMKKLNSLNYEEIV